MHGACTFQFMVPHECCIQSPHGVAVDSFVGLLMFTLNGVLFRSISQVAKALASEKQIRFAPFADGRLTEVSGCRPSAVLIATASFTSRRALEVALCNG